MFYLDLHKSLIHCHTGFALTLRSLSEGISSKAYWAITDHFSLPQWKSWTPTVAIWMQVIFQLIKHIDNSKQMVDFKEAQNCTPLSSFIKSFLIWLVCIKEIDMYNNEQRKREINFTKYTNPVLYGKYIRHNMTVIPILVWSTPAPSDELK